MDEEERSLGISFPLPFRVLVLIGLGILGWAANLHGLAVLKVDAVSALELRNLHRKGRTDPYAFYNPVYRIFLLYLLWCFSSWLLFRHLTNGNPFLVDVFGYIPGVAALVVALALICPFNIFYKRERDRFIQAIQRCLFSSMDSPVYFSDVVLADILTSFAKVFGDVWLTARMLFPGNSLLTLPSEDSWVRWVMPTIMSFPYLLRLRQCLIEYGLPVNTSRRPLLNAVKYATAFPVIYLSAAQRIVVLDLVKEKGDKITKDAWHGEHQLFRLWLLAALINSLYSFWWDITNDWGLDLLKPRSQKNTLTPVPRRLALPHLHSGSPLLATEFPNDEHVHGLSGETGIQYPYGLRPVLLYPLPVYPLLIFLNLVLRLTWSVKLSSHLHSKTDGSATIFWLEVAEVFRRWMWVFLRVEWEVIKRGRELRPGHNGDEIDYEMIRTPERECIPDA